MVRRNAILLALVAACALATDVSAQTLTLPSQRPVHGLFGRAASGDGLDVTVISFVGVDDDGAGGGIGGLSGGPGLDSRDAANGQFDGFDISTLYAKKTGHVTFGVAERSGIRYYPNLDNLVGIQHNLAGGVSGQVGRTQINVAQTVGYQPFYSFSTLPGLFEAQPGDVATSTDPLLVTRPSLSLTTSGTLSQTMGRAVLSFAGSMQRTEFTEESVTALQAESVMGRFLYHLSRDLGLVVAYGVQQGPTLSIRIASRPTTSATSRSALDYDRALSISRRTKIGFTTGTAAVGDSTTSGSIGYQLVGDGRISREFGRTWLATASYRRSVGMIAGFPQPMFSDGLAGSITGLGDPAADDHGDRRLFAWRNDRHADQEPQRKPTPAQRRRSSR